ncbi:SBBP repeat-containing protein [Candidatus Woesearchaeota archaeon]|nr:SBBP repeat-containing protein [Candidatus Woesearchaeota archaeon]USN43986.1 MAG: SBBP repeat-containing protein [Candidatus Woesearchaeota archaeon]
MNILRRGISPVVAVALLLVVAVVAVVMFSAWFDSFRSSLFTAAETKTSESQTVDIIDLVGEELFFQAGTNTSVSSVTVSNNECDFSSGVFSGLHVFDLTSCLDASGSSVEAVVVTDKGIYSKTFFVRESYSSRELLPVLLWNVTYDGGGLDAAYGIALGSSGNVYVTGRKYNGGNYDYLTFKYDTDGNEIWNVTYDGAFGHDYAYGIAVDSLENIYVTGYSRTATNYDYLTFKYDADGNEIWNVSYDTGNNDGALTVAVDTNENVYVNGKTSNGIDTDYTLVKYDSTGNEVWNVTYDGGNSDFGLGIDTDSLGNVYVTGNTYDGLTWQYLTMKYNSSGSQIWNSSFEGGGVYDWGDNVVVDASGNVYVTGSSNNSVSYEYVTVKFDSNGNQIWNVTYDGGSDDHAQGMALDTSGNVYVTGLTTNGGVSDYLTFKYDTNGNQIWNVTYNSGNDDGAQGIVVDTSGNVYVTGWTNNGTYNFLTFKYAQE